MPNVQQIAVRAKFSVRQVNRSPLVFIAPSLVQAAVDGRLPRGIGLQLYAMFQQNGPGKARHLGYRFRQPPNLNADRVSSTTSTSPAAGPSQVHLPAPRPELMWPEEVDARQPPTPLSPTLSGPREKNRWEIRRITRSFWLRTVIRSRTRLRINDFAV